MRCQSIYEYTKQLLLVSSLPLLLGACSQQFQVNPDLSSSLSSSLSDGAGTGTNPVPDQPGPQPGPGGVGENGAQLYATNCAACHGALATSTKLGRSQTQISNSILSIPQMMGLKSLSSAQVQAITQALQPVASGQSCAPTEVLSQQVRRLTKDQMHNTMVQAFGNIIALSDLPDLGDANPRIGFASDPQLLIIEPVNMATYQNSIKNIVTKIIAQNATVRNCQTATVDTCFTNVIQEFGLKLWRRPLTTAESTELMDGQKAVLAYNGSRSLRLSVVLNSLLLSPNYLFRTELGTLDTGTSLFQLTPYEIASYISFSVINSGPDTVLLDAARNGKLSTTTEIKEQIARLLKTAQWKNGIENFIVDFTKVNDVLTEAKSSTLNVNVAHRAPILESAKRTIQDSYATTKSDISAPFSATRFYATAATAGYYSIGTAGLGTSNTVYNIDQSQRHGILSHPAFLFSVSGEVSSGIVKRGVYTLEQLLCEHLGAPPDEINPVTNLPPGFDANKVTSREVLHITHSSQSTCFACHQKIDPAGFGFENFDALGKFRLFEKGSVAINSAGSLTTSSGEVMTFKNSLEYVKELVESKSFQSCLQKKMFKYVTGQNYNEGAGSCESKNFAKSMTTKGNTVESVYESLVELKSFKTRKPASAK